MNKIRFSVATPTRNSLDKLKRCVGSVRGQTEVSVEHIIQDAQSTDGTPDWLANQQGLIAFSESDKGMYDAINKAWGHASGEFLSWLNSDEQYLPGTLAKVQAYFDANPEVDIVFGNYIVTNSTGKPIALRREIPFRTIYVTNSFLNMQSATIFFRSHLWDSKKLQLDDKYRYAADKDLILRLAKEKIKIKHIPDYLSIFEIDGTNLSTHSEMHVESEHIRLKFGAFKLKTLRKFILIFRRIERLKIGAYCKNNITFKYATNEIPEYKLISGSKLGGSYNLSEGSKK